MYSPGSQLSNTRAREFWFDGKQGSKNDSIIYLDISLSEHKKGNNSVYDEEGNDGVVDTSHTRKIL